MRQAQRRRRCFLELAQLPLAGKGLQVGQALEQVLPAEREAVAVAAVATMPASRSSLMRVFSVLGVMPPTLSCSRRKVCAWPSRRAQSTRRA
jgi:hypothetical protein